MPSEEGTELLKCASLVSTSSPLAGQVLHEPWLSDNPAARARQAGQPTAGARNRPRRKLLSLKGTGVREDGKEVGRMEGYIQARERKRERERERERVPHPEKCTTKLEQLRNYLLPR